MPQLGVPELLIIGVPIILILILITIFKGGSPFMKRAGNSDMGTNEVRTGLIEVRDKTLVFGNSICQIKNISSIEIGYINKSIPFLFWVVLVIGGGLFLTEEGYGLIGLIAAGIILLYWWNTRKIHGLLVNLNSGLTKIIFSRDLEFLKNVAIVLYDVIEKDISSSITFNLDQRQIVDNVKGSTVVLGDTRGDIVNSIQ